MMRDLTTADIAFLLCTSKRGSFRFSLSTDFGLVLDIGASGTIKASLERPGEARPDSPSGRLRSIAPPSPVCPSPMGDSIDAIMLTPTSTVAPGFPLSPYPFNDTASQRQQRWPVNSSADSPRTPTLIQRSTSKARPRKPTIITTHQAPLPTPAQTPTRTTASTRRPPLISTRAPAPGYKYLITTSYNYPTSNSRPSSPMSTTSHNSLYNHHRRCSSSSSTLTSSSSYIFYAPNWPHNPRSPTLFSLSTPQTGPKPIYEKLVREEDLEVRYSAQWFEAYMNWVNRSRRAVRRAARRRSRQMGMGIGLGLVGVEGDRSGGSGDSMDEGERTLWTVEGLLLASWLCLQGDCAAVEYAPFGAGGGEEAGEELPVYMLNKEDVGRVIGDFLGGVRT